MEQDSEKIEALKRALIGVKDKRRGIYHSQCGPRGISERCSWIIFES